MARIHYKGYQIKKMKPEPWGGGGESYHVGVLHLKLGKKSTKLPRKALISCSVLKNAKMIITVGEK